MAQDENRAVAEASQRLSIAFPDLPADIVRGTVQRHHQQFAGCPIRDFVPVLVERKARTSLVERRTLRAGEATDRIPQQSSPTAVSQPPGRRVDDAEITG